MKIEDLQAYEILEKKQADDINSVTYLLRHRKTRARIALIVNDDDNKVFYIGFRTTPKDSTGVAHIMEHSVLCGSEHFPVKDPFVELVKGSLNTFLNAITYPDKTLYPIASCNDKDFHNLLHVYMDSVFYPQIYHNEAIFRQEGWHYELNDQDELIYNGVVYNEMKGALSSPDSVLLRELPTLLYPHTTYANESGGDTECIPELTYEAFLDFHREYYHPSNSYIYLYGNADMAKELDFIDKEYLSRFSYRQVDSQVEREPEFDAPARKVKEIAITDEDDAFENTYLSYGCAIGDSLDPERMLALKILDFVLMDVPGAVLKQTLLDKGLGRDVFSTFDGSCKQPLYAVVAKGIDPQREQEFIDTVHGVIKDIVTRGFDEKTLYSAINYLEFRYREADYGATPKGLMYGISLFDSWLFDDEKPFVHLLANRTYASLKEKVKDGYFEKVLQENLFANNHRGILLLSPQRGLTEKREEALCKKLSEKRASLTETQEQEIRDMMEKLRVFRESEDAPENLSKLPMLGREDLKREASVVGTKESRIGDTKLLHHDIFTNGIGYLKLLFKIEHIPMEYVPYISILKNALCNMDTAHFSYGRLCEEINLVTGGIGVGQGNYANVRDEDDILLTMEVGTKALYRSLPQAFEIMGEILTTDFSDQKRLREILAEYNSGFQESMQKYGHLVAVGRALSYQSKREACDELLNGLDNYRITSALEKNFDEEKDKIVEILSELMTMIFRPENLIVDFTGSKEALPVIGEQVERYKTKLFTGERRMGEMNFTPVKRNEGLTSSGQVVYVCRAGNFKKHGLEYTGALNILRAMMGYEFLWTNVRVKGGAYDVLCNFGQSGNCYFVSYRDPNLKKTIDTYEQAAQFIEEYEADERTLTKYIIGAISELDTPLSASRKGAKARNEYLTHLTHEMIQKARDQVLDVTVEDIRGLAAYIRAFMEDDCLCVVGNEKIIRKEKELFGTIENLF